MMTTMDDEMLSDVAALISIASGLGVDADAIAPSALIPDANISKSLQEIMIAYKTLLSLDLTCINEISPSLLVEASMEGTLSLSSQYAELLRAVAIESGLSSAQLGTLGVSLSVPNFMFTRDHNVEFYVAWMGTPKAFDAEGGRRMTAEEQERCILASELHIGLSLHPTVESALQTLLAMPSWALVRAWQRTRQQISNQAGKNEESDILGFCPRDAKALLQQQQGVGSVHSIDFKTHRLAIAHMLAHGDVIIGADSWENVLEQRLLLQAGKINVERFQQLEKQIAEAERRPGSVRLLFFMAMHPSVYPEYSELLRVARRECKQLKLL